MGVRVTSVGSHSSDVAGSARELRRATARATELSWRRWATRHRVAAAMLAGLVGTHVATLLGFWFGPFKLTRLDYNTANGGVYLPNASPLSQFLYGGLSHYLDGVFFAVIFAVGIAPRLPFGSSARGNMLKALAFSTILALLALFVTAPYVFGPTFTGVYDPLISFKKGWNNVFSVFLWHWIYGAHLGLIYNPVDEPSVESS
jgi:hypothetical protein